MTSSVALTALALLVLGGAAAALTRRNLVHAALLLALSWLGLAGVYLWCGAAFAAFAQVLVYVGAVSMVVLFAVLLTRRDPSGDEVVDSRLRISGGLAAAVAVFAVLAFAVVNTPFSGVRPSVPELSTRELGTHLAGDQGPALVILGLLLTVALVGAVSLAAGMANASGKEEQK